MRSSELEKALSCAVGAAKAAGALMRSNLGKTKIVHSRTTHDVKLELDVRCQKLIIRRLHRAFPDIESLGEEGDYKPLNTAHRWVVDPIDGTVNFSHSIPHAAVSIALQERCTSEESGYKTIAGVVYEPFLNELYTAMRGRPALLNGRRLHVSRTTRLDKAVVSVGFGKNVASLRRSLRLYNALSAKAQKARNMGSASLALVYVAAGRFDACVERGVNLWDIAAGGFIVTRAGGRFDYQLMDTPLTYRMLASNGRLARTLQQIMSEARC